MDERWECVPKPQLLEYYRLMLRIRRCEERIGWLFSHGLTMGTAHLSIGQEACAVGVLSAAEPTDYAVSTHRGHGHLLAKGADPARLLAEICGRVTGFCRGKGGSQHMAVREIGFLGTNGITGGGLPVATGAALSCKLRQTGQVVFCFFGDGAANQGTFHESLNMASIWKLPIVYVCENNSYAMWTPCREVTSVADIAARGAAYSLPSHVIDGMDLLAVQEVASAAAARARAGGGPTLLEAKTYRFCGHSKSENGKGYRPGEEITEWEARDALSVWRARLVAGGMPPADLEAVEAEVAAEIEAATQLALSSPYAEDEALIDAYAGGGVPSFSLSGGEAGPFAAPLDRVAADGASEVGPTPDVAYAPEAAPIGAHVSASLSPLSVDDPTADRVVAEVGGEG